MPDRIILEGMRFFAFHGNNPEERELGQPFVVDLELETGPVHRWGVRRPW